MKLKVLQKDAKIEVKFEAERGGEQLPWMYAELADLVQCPGVGETLKSLIGYGSFVRYWDVGWFSEEPALCPPNFVGLFIEAF